MKIRKKTKTWLAIAVAGWLSASGSAAAEDQTYYGWGDGSNTGNISDVNWVLDQDYDHYGGHQWFFNAYTQEGTVSNIGSFILYQIVNRITPMRAYISTKAPSGICI